MDANFREKARRIETACDRPTALSVGGWVRKSGGGPPHSKTLARILRPSVRGASRSALPIHRDRFPLTNPYVNHLQYQRRKTDKEKLNMTISRTPLRWKQTEKVDL